MKNTTDSTSLPTADKWMAPIYVGKGETLTYSGSPTGIVLCGGTLKITSAATTIEDFTLTGTGEVQVNANFTVGKRSTLDFTSISVVMSTTNTRIIAREGVTIKFGDFPVLRGKFTTASAKNEVPPQIIAPPKFIFSGTAIEGDFYAENSYPEWFYNGVPKTGEVEDWAPAINKALSIKRNGVTRLQCRVYKVATTIFLPAKGRLVGERSGVAESSVFESNDTGTTIKPVFGSDGESNFTGGCVVLVNLKPDKVKGKSYDFLKAISSTFTYNGETYTQNDFVDRAWSQLAQIKNIFFFNRKGTGDSAPSLISGLCAILCVGQGEFESLRFSYFRNAIVWSDWYADMKKVTRCIFNRVDLQGEGDYQVDFGSLGDALIFEGNAFHMQDSIKVGTEGDGGCRALRMRSCFGGFVKSNVINGDVLIGGSRGVNFSNNHMESGAQLRIHQSSCIVESNYFEKGLRPSIVISSNEYGDLSTVNLVNNAFVYYPVANRVVINKDGKYTKIGEGTALGAISDFDIEFRGASPVEASATVHISNQYRYWVPSGIASKMYTYGIALSRLKNDTIEAVAIEEYNQRSQYLSESSTLVLSSGVPHISFPPVTVSALKGKDSNDNTVYYPNIAYGKPNEHAIWYEVAGTYDYYYQVIWDIRKKYVWPLTTLVTGVVVDKLGPLFKMYSGASGVGNCVMVRVIRRFGSDNNKVYYADIPFVNTFFFYDNGVSIGTYKWKKSSGGVSGATISGTNPPSVMTFINGIVMTDG